MRNSWMWTVATVATIALGANAHAEVKKFMNICGAGKLCPSFELAATPPDAWVIEKDASKQAGMTMMVPKGKNYGNAETLIYIKVSPQQDNQSLEDFIKVSQERWRKATPDTKITKMPEVARKNGKAAFQPYQYENPSQPQQAFEYVAFGEDTDPEGNKYFAMVVMTGRNRKLIEQAGAPYRAFLGAH